MTQRIVRILTIVALACLSFVVTAPSTEYTAEPGSAAVALIQPLPTWELH